MTEKKLPMRNGVGVIIFNKNKKIFVGKRKDNPVDKWQMPQGVLMRRDYFSAMKRELEEETSIINFKILKELEGFFEYELPENLIGIIWKGQFRGQKQKWFIAEYLGEDSEINLNTKNPEFIEWKWISPDELPNVIVDFKKNMYKKLLIKIKEFID